MKISKTYTLVFLTVFIFLSGIISAQEKINNNGYNKFYYDNGILSSEGTMRDGKPDGYWKTYFDNGKIKSEGNRINFQLDSTWKFYNIEGVLVLEYFYKNGKKNGPRKNYEAKEKYLVSEENYIDDVKTGTTKYYYKRGQTQRVVPFKDGRENGIGYEYDTTGTIITITEYKGGFTKHTEKINRRDGKGFKQGMWKEFYPSMVVKNECPYLENLKNGYYKEYSPDGKLQNTSKYENGKLVENPPELQKLDLKTEYYEGGIVKSTGAYKNGVPEGYFKEYSKEGVVIASKIFKDGILIGEGILDEANKEQGPWKEYYPNGQLKGKGEYKDGKRIGEWLFYFANGKTEQVGKYDKKGRAQGAWKWYYDTGKLLREENYLDDKRDGLMIEYGDSGNVVTKGEYYDGMQEGKWIYEMGDYKEIGIYKGDRRDSTWIHLYIPSGKKRFEGKYIDGNPDGKHVYYYPNGKIKEQGKYVIGRKEGDWDYYSEEGLKFLTITYKDDVEIKYDGIKLKPAFNEEPSKK